MVIIMTVVMSVAMTMAMMMSMLMVSVMFMAAPMVFMFVVGGGHLSLTFPVRRHFRI